jgi:thiamine biosynthesis lipoprotein
MAKSTSHRRDFLTGRSAAQALSDLVEPADPPPAASGSPTAPYLLEFGRRAMACQFEVLVNAGRYPHAAEAALAALDLVDELEAQMTVYRPSSEILEINASAARQPVEVEPRLFALLRQALALHRETEGAFDITSGPLTKVWGFSRRQGGLPTEDDLQAALARVGSQHVELDPQGRTVQFLMAGIELNLNSIGKGYALDRCAEQILAAGIDDFLWHGGNSSILARGSQTPGSHEGWSVFVSHPLRPGKRLAEIRLRDRSLGTSGAANQFFRHQGRRYGHILDPRTGWPAEGVYSVTVAAPEAAEADALATALYVMGPDRAVEYCSRRPEIGLLMVCPEPGATGTRLITLGFQEGELVFLKD